jgi:hypothetical protein
MSTIITRAPRDARLYSGADANVAKQFPLWDKGSVVRYWAERGLVHWEDSKDNSYGSMPWQDAAHRVLALSEMIHNSRKKGLYGDEIRKTQKFIEEMEPVIRQARRQGGPLDNMHEVATERRARAAKIVPLNIANDPLEFKPARPAKNDPYKGVQLPKAKAKAKAQPKAKPVSRLILP